MPMRADVRLLVVDDDPDIGRLLGALLTKQGYTAVTQVSTAEAALAEAADADVVILDHQLPDSDGIDLLRTLRSRPEPPGVVMITGHGNEELAAEALRRGADDYLIKDGSLPHLLPEVVDRVMRERATRRALAAAEEELLNAERLAAIGEMTVTLHHEINNPLMAAMAEVDLMLGDSNGLTDAQRASLNATRDALLRISEMVRTVSKLRAARSTEYAGDLKMIDLVGGSTGSGPSRQPTRGRALFYHPDQLIARVGMMVVRHAGWDVARCERFEDLGPAMQQPGVTLLVFASTPEQSLPDGIATGERPKLLALAGDDDAADAAQHADLVVRVPFDPGTFAAELELLMS